MSIHNLDYVTNRCEHSSANVFNWTNVTLLAKIFALCNVFNCSIACKGFSVFVLASLGFAVYKLLLPALIRQIDLFFCRCC